MTELLVHPIAQHHAARGVGGLHEIIGGAGRKMLEKNKFGGAAAEQYGHPVFQLFQSHQEAIFGRPLDGVAQRADPARDDRYLVNGVLTGQRDGDDRMAELVIGDDAAFLRDKEPVLLLQAGNDPFHRGGEIAQMHAVGAAPRRQQRRLVDKIGEVGAGKAGRQFGDLHRIDVLRQHRLFQMHLQDCNPILLVGAVDQDLAVETAGAQQRRIEYLRPVGGSEQDDAGRGIEPSSSPAID